MVLDMYFVLLNLLLTCKRKKMIQYEMLTEQQIEDLAERHMDKLDKKLMRGEITQSEYEREVFILDKWTAQQYKAQEQAA